MKRERLFALCVVFTLSVGFECSSGQANPATNDVQVSISPVKVVEGDGTPVEIVCSSEVLSKVLMISLAHGDNLAFVRDGSRVTYSNGNMSKHIKAEGVVSHNARESFLKLTIAAPISSDGGVYDCKFYFLDDYGLMQYSTDNASLTVEVPPPVIVTTKSPSVTNQCSAESILSNLLDRLVQIELNGELQPYWVIGLTDQERRDLLNCTRDNKTQVIWDKDSLNLKALTDRLAKLESIVHTSLYVNNNSNSHAGGNCTPGCGGTTSAPTTDMKLLDRVEKLEKENKNISQQLEWISEKVIPDPTAGSATPNLLNRVKKLESDSSKQAKQLATLHAKEASASSFHATFNQLNVEAKKGMVLSFPDVLTMQGQGFNPQTGIFTAPIDGVYGFHLSIDNLGQGTCVIALKADSRYFSLMTTGNAQDKGETSISSVIKLKAGQEVKAIVVDVQGQTLLRGYAYSAFTGYLIWS